MFKLHLALAVIIGAICSPAAAADVAIGGLPITPNPTANAAPIKTVDGVPVVEDNTKQNLKSVKDLFKKSKDSAPQAPDIISNQPKIINVDSIDNKVIKPPVAPVVDAKPTQNTEGTIIKIAPETATDKDFSANLGGKSIMFDQTNIYRVMRVLSAYIESNSSKANEEVQQESKKSLEELQRELLAKLKPNQFVKGKKDIVTVRLPAYVKLDSIMFNSPINKQAWINSRKFKEGENSGELTVKSIQKDYAYIDLSTKDTNVTKKKLDDMLKNSKSANRIKIDAEKQTISFRLSVNQYIDLVKMRILEGEFDKTSVDLNNKVLRYYDPMKPEDRFMPLEDEKRATELEYQEEVKQREDALRASSNQTTEDVKFEAIDAKEDEAGTKPAEAEKTAIETSPEKL